MSEPLYIEGWTCEDWGFARRVTLKGEHPPGTMVAAFLMRHADPDKVHHLTNQLAVHAPPGVIEWLLRPWASDASQCSQQSDHPEYLGGAKGDKA